MNFDKDAFELIASALEPNAKITRNGYFQIEQALAHIAKRLKDLVEIEKPKQPDVSI